jgi:hypothetical protein
VATGVGSTDAARGDGGIVRHDERNATRQPAVMSNEPGKALTMDFMRGLYRLLDEHQR